MRDEECALRVERGQVSPDELAAVAAVLFAHIRAKRSEVEPVAVTRPRTWSLTRPYSAPGGWR
ncbi:acyl-CoA carboxylase epsilon subunit [Streptomyces sp. NPDC002012]|uniref:acyl-CoA carboxylase epsilon subunit n=1 Tax=unclassified Streptomyces TaxID=2593676 RepID=UPI002E1002E6|nr:acyl-CoA carboxylase subunit epsilon [Streptomyces sp. NBC_01224]